MSNDECLLSIREKLIYLQFDGITQQDVEAELEKMRELLSITDKEVKAAQDHLTEEIEEEF